MRLRIPPSGWLPALLITSAATAAASVANARTAGTPPRPENVAPTAGAVGAPGPLRQEAATSAELIQPVSAAPAISTEGIAEARDRLTTLDTRSPAADVERWVIRLTSGEQAAETQAALERFSVYEPLIRQALHDASLPQDLAFLPLIESSYRTQPTSRAGAVGLWQFMGGTARGYGLEVSAWVDERRDPVRSTFAAVGYLRDLHREFGAWHLAAAAYNAGGGRVGRVLRRRGRGRDGAFWEVRHRLPGETRAYVPKLLAAARIGRSPERYGLRRGARPPLQFREVHVRGGTSLDALSQAYGIDPKTVRDLNPHLVQARTPPGRTWPVRLPASVALPRNHP
jgi:soluble lytic murein transglycosylase-like protein